MRAFPLKEKVGKSDWKTEPITTAQFWRIQADRTRLGMPAIHEGVLGKMTKGEASDMISEMVNLIALQSEDLEETASAYDGYDPPWI